jgi:hypothetical protein
VSPWIKRKPKSHLGILKEEKRPKEKSFFPREIERLRESKRRESFHFSGEEIAAEKWHESQGKSKGTDFEAASRKENLYSTDLVRQHLLYLFSSYSSTKIEENSALNRPYRLYGCRTVAFNSGHVFQ